jgi:hypothetical protein
MLGGVVPMREVLPRLTNHTFFSCLSGEKSARAKQSKAKQSKAKQSKAKQSSDLL